jgi:hypothetical protein
MMRGTFASKAEVERQGEDYKVDKYAEEVFE